MVIYVTSMPRYIDGVKRIKKRSSPAAKEPAAEEDAREKQISLERNVFFDGVKLSAGKLFNSIQKKKKAVINKLKDRKEHQEEKKEKKLKEDFRGEAAEEISEFFKKEEPSSSGENNNHFPIFNFFRFAEKSEKQKLKEECKKNKMALKQQWREREEQERLAKISRDKKERDERQNSIAEQAKRHRERLRQNKEMARKAKAKIKAERLASKLRKKEEREKIKGEGKKRWLIFKEKNQSRRVKKKKQFFIGLKKQSKKIALAGAAAIIIFLAAAGALSYFVYGPYAQNKYAELLAQKFHFPAVVVNYRPVSYSAYINESRLMGDYYLAEAKNKEQSDKIPADINGLIKEEIIVKSILDSLARHYNIKLETQDTNNWFQKLAEQQGGADVFLDKIYNSYGLTKDIFAEKVVYYEALKEKLKEKFIGDQGLHKGAYLRMEKVQKLLDKNKDNFEDYAQKYSEDIHALKGGDIGYIKLSGMGGKLKEAVLGLQAGNVSGIIKEEDKYYIIKVYDIKDGRAGQEVWLKQITIFTNYTFEKYLEDLRSQAKVWTLINH